MIWDIVQHAGTLTLDPKQSCNITDSDQGRLQYTSHFFNSKFIKELDSKQNAYKKKERRIRDFSKLKFIKQAIFQNITNKKEQNLLNSDQSSDSGQSNFQNKKQFEYKGHIIQGKLKRKILNGDTTIIYNNGTQFQGSYENGRMKAGKFDFKNGYQYWGQLNGKQFYGKGTLKCPDGKRITGQWRGQYLIGRVQIQYPSGDVYYGEVQNFMKHGKGYLFFKTGNKYIGNFKNGQINGYGAYFQTDGKVFRGIWRGQELLKEENQQNQNNDQIQQTKQMQNGFESFQKLKQSDQVFVSQVLNFQIKESKKI